MTPEPHTTHYHRPETDTTPAAYLRREAGRTAGSRYSTSASLADEPGLSPGEMAVQLRWLGTSASGLEVETWSHTAATTWRIRTGD